MKCLCVIAVFTAVPAVADSVVATRVLRPGTLIAPQDVKISKDVRGGFTDISEVVGYETAYALYPDRPIQPDALRSPSLVDRNALVQLLYQSRGLIITAEGRSLGRAGRGERVRVMNLGSKRIVYGIAIDPSIVVVVQ